MREVRRTGYDIAYDVQGLLKSAVLARASGARRVVGFARAYLRDRGAAVFYTEARDIGGAVHVVDKNLALVGPEVDARTDAATASPVSASGVSGSLRREFPLSSVESRAPALVRDLLGIGPAGRFTLINPSAGWVNKRWPPDRFGAVAAHLASRHQVRSVVLWGPGEGELAQAVAAASQGAAIVAPQTTIDDVIALGRAAALMIAGDTGPMHLASAAGAPVVGIFGPTNPARNGPLGVDDVSVSRFERCGCHHLRRCREARWCLADIGIDEMTAAVDRRLS
jgi:ADP-heptose:LPS heptosyltransferase